MKRVGGVGNDCREIPNVSFSVEIYSNADPEITGRMKMKCFSQSSNCQETASCCQVGLFKSLLQLLGQLLDSGPAAPAVITSPKPSQKICSTCWSFVGCVTAIKSSRID